MPWALLRKRLHGLCKLLEKPLSLLMLSTAYIHYNVLKGAWMYEPMPLFSNGWTDPLESYLDSDDIEDAAFSDNIHYLRCLYYFGAPLSREEKCAQARTFASKHRLPALVGSAKQICYAECIRYEFLNSQEAKNNPVWVQKAAMLCSSDIWIDAYKQEDCGLYTLWAIATVLEKGPYAEISGEGLRKLQGDFARETALVNIVKAGVMITSEMTIESDCNYWIEIEKRQMNRGLPRLSISVNLNQCGLVLKKAV